ncbi:Fc.00g107980.m01.CDS01 [Cosmosporella sp. VM-42]
MSPSRPQPPEEKWLRLKAAIRRLYLVQRMPLKSLVVEVGNLGLSVTEAQLEYKLKQWKFRRNIDKANWITTRP